MRKLYVLVLLYLCLYVIAFASPQLEIVAPSASTVSAIQLAANTLVTNGYGDAFIYLKKVIYDPNTRRSQVKVSEATFYLKENPLKDMSQGWLASVLVHEAWHIRLQLEGKSWYGYDGEKACLMHQLEYLRKYGSSREVKWAEYILRNIDDPAFQWWKD